MKKIPTLFKREFVNNQKVNILPEITEGIDSEILKYGIPTVKWDGSCCAIIDGVFYKRYDAKNGKPVPEGAIKCQEKADPITGHLPCWIKCDRENPADKWFWNAYDKATTGNNIYAFKLANGTYEAVGKHFNGNPYLFEEDYLVKHGTTECNIPKDENGYYTFDAIKNYLEDVYIEGIVFWDRRNGNDFPVCKIKRSDFGFDWGNKK